MSVVPKSARRRYIGPHDAGRAMSLEQFARAAGEPGYVYELERRVVVVVDVPGMPHARVVQRVRRAFDAYQEQRPDIIDLVAGSNDSVLRMPAIQSERHPDVAVYFSPPPTDNEQAWDEWTPDIVVEVVSRSSRRRDYGVKVDDYLAAGVRQYWIMDPLTRNATLHVRRGDQWRKSRLGLTITIRTPLLPGFKLALPDVFSSLR